MFPSFIGTKHPDYNVFNLDWIKFRLAYEGGRIFRNKYLERFSEFETDEQFQRRKKLSYTPAFAKAAINDVRNSIYQRFSDIKRIDGSKTYQEAVAGIDGGVDRCGNTMNSFMGCEVLPELMVLGRVGIYVDMPPLKGPTKADNVGIRPYVYFYRAEDIYNWTEDEQQNITSVILKERVFDFNEEGMPTGIRERCRHLCQKLDGVYVTVYDEINASEKPTTVKLNLRRIPFIMARLSGSLMTDIADYQIALMNLASSDMNFVLNANFPFYVEQYNPVADLQGIMKQNIQNSLTEEGSQAAAEVSGDQQAKIGIMTGRRYPMGVDAPTFIHPSTEPLTASMAKQEQLKGEIRLLLNLSIANLQPKRQSADSKVQDERPLENGLSYIGLELEHCERLIAEIWADYEDSTPSTVHYPHNYSMKSDEDAQREAEEIEKNLHKLPSVTYQKELAKRVAKLRLGCNVSLDTLKKVNSEIDKAKTMNCDPEVITQDLENGLVGNELASEMRGYPKGEVEKATKDHAEKLARIAESQASGAMNGAARGVPAMATDPKGATQEKKDSKNTPESPVPVDNTRGEGK